MCILKNEEGQSIQQRIFPGTSECLCIDISWTGSGVTQPTEHTKRVDVTLKSRREVYLKLLSTAENDDNLRGHLATLLLRPFVSSTSEPDATGVIDGGLHFAE